MLERCQLTHCIIPVYFQCNDLMKSLYPGVWVFGDKACWWSVITARLLLPMYLQWAKPRQGGNRRPVMASQSIKTSAQTPHPDPSPPRQRICDFQKRTPYHESSSGIMHNCSTFCLCIPSGWLYCLCIMHRFSWTIGSLSLAYFG